MKLTVQMFTMSNPEGRVSELISQLKIHHHFDIGTEEQGVAYCWIHGVGKQHRLS